MAINRFGANITERSVRDPVAVGIDMQDTARPSTARRVPLTSKARAFYNFVACALKVLALFSLILFLYTAGARDKRTFNLRRFQLDPSSITGYSRSFTNSGGNEKPGNNGDEEETESADTNSESTFVPLSPRRLDWASSIPKHCDDILKNPRPYDKSCLRKASTFLQLHYSFAYTDSN